jgi:hypothetical protein
MDQSVVVVEDVKSTEIDDANTSVPLNLIKKDGMDFVADDKGEVDPIKSIDYFVENAEKYSNEYMRDFVSVIYKYLDSSSLAHIPSERIQKLRELINPFGRTISGANCFLNCSVVQSSRRFDMNMALIGIQAYLFRALDEYKMPEGIPNVSVAEYIKNESLLDTPKAMLDKHDEIGAAKFEYARRAMKEKASIYAFLETMFQFNPDDHVRSSYVPNPADPTRKPLRTKAAKVAVDYLKKKDPNIRSMCELQEKFLHEQGIDPSTGLYIKPRKKKVKRTQHEVITGRNGEKKNITRTEIVEVDDVPVEPGLHNMPFDPKIYDPSHIKVHGVDQKEITQAMLDQQYDPNLRKQVTEMIPPADLLARIKIYMQSNYEQLLGVVNDMYAEKPDLHLMVNPYSWHTNRQDAEDFVKKHSKEVIATVYTFESGKWNIIADLQEIRERVNFYNENTKILEAMTRQREMDEKMANELMKKKVARKKQENVIEAGPHAQSFKKWKAQSELAKETNVGAQADDDLPDDSVQLDMYLVGKSGTEVVKEYMAIAAERPTIQKPDDDETN